MAYKEPLGAMRLKPEEIMKRQEIAQRKKDEFQQLYQDAYEFALPQLAVWGLGRRRDRQQEDAAGLRLDRHQLDPALCQPAAVCRLSAAAQMVPA